MGYREVSTGGILPSPTAIDQLFIMSREYGIGADVVRCTFYMSASLPKLSSPERERKKKGTEQG